MTESVQLATRAFGPADRSLPLVVIAHGLLGQGRNWQAIAKRLAEGRRVVTVDLRNHGHSPWSETMTYEAMAADLAQVMTDQGAERASFVGHSMGGKAVMTLALREPALVSHLGVVDIAPVDYDHRDFGVYVTAMQRVDLAHCQRRADVEAALETAEPDPRVRAFLASNVEGAADEMRWLPNLPVLQRALNGILSFAPPTGASFDGPALFVAGEHSDYVRGQQEAILRYFPHARIESIADAGHWVHADKPAQTIEVLDSFLPRME